MTLKVVLRPSPKSDKKFRVMFLTQKKVVDFGAKGYSDFTLHKDPERMRRYVQRHGGNVSGLIHKMIDVTKSTKENWSKKGVYTPGFWSRWLLWSYPSLSKAKAFMSKKFGFVFV